MARDEGQIFHFGLVRLRVVGSGNLEMNLYSYDEIEKSSLVDLTLSNTNKKELTRLCNFSQQRAFFEGKVDEIDEWFEISKIVIFIKPVANEFPST